jgi:hypothetical protein
MAEGRVFYILRNIIAEACIRLINNCLHTSVYTMDLHTYGEVLWKTYGADLWFGFLFGLAAVMVARWLYATEKRA